MRKYIFILLSFISLPLLSQQSVLDSLKTELAKNLRVEIDSAYIYNHASYFDENNILKYYIFTQTSDGNVYIMKYEQDSLGRVIEQRTYDEELKLRTRDYSIVKTYYDDENITKLELYKDEDNLYDKGIAIYELIYDEEGNLLERNFYDGKNEKAENPHCFCHINLLSMPCYSIKYQHSDLISTISFYDKKDKIISHRKIEKYQVKYKTKEKKVIEEVRFLEKGGKLGNFNWMKLKPPRDEYVIGLAYKIEQRKKDYAIEEYIYSEEQQKLFTKRYNNKGEFVGDKQRYWNKDQERLNYKEQIFRILKTCF